MRGVESQSAASSLCPSCGFCCNGVLFGDVELQPRDRPARLRRLGLSIGRKGRKTCLFQPCPALEGLLCRVYADRPERCRAFECRLLQGVIAGSLQLKTGLRAVRRARRQMERVDRLVRELGQIDESVPLNRRFQRIMAEPFDQAGDPAVLRRRSRLMIEVHELTKILGRDFLG